MKAVLGFLVGLWSSVAHHLSPTGGWFRHVLGRSLTAARSSSFNSRTRFCVAEASPLVAFHATGEALAVVVNLDKAFAALVTNPMVKSKRANLLQLGLHPQVPDRYWPC